jgi:PAS domain S-box-containing protein
MINEKNNKDKLREKAEKLLESQINPIDNLTIDEYVHELRVHEIELEIQNEELREAQVNLEDSRRKYFDLYNFAPVGYFTLDKDGLILEVNISGADLLGVDRIDMQKSAFIKYIVPEHRTRLYHHFKMVLETKMKQSIEIKLVKKNNDSFYALLETLVMLGNEDTNGFRVTVTNIQELKDSENALKQSEERYRQIFVNNHAIMILIDPAIGDIVDANPAASDFYGYSHDELVKMKIDDLNVSGNNFVYGEMQRAVSNQKNHFTFKHRLSNGEIRDVDVYSGLINQKDKNILYSIIYDITAQKKAEIALRESEELFRLIFDQSPIGSLIASLDFTPLRVNKALSIMLGYSTEELLTMKFPEYTYPDDLNTDLEFRELLISGVIDNFVMEKRYIHKNGKIVWGNLYVSAVKDQSNRLVKILTMVEDITERKEMENLVIQRSNKLANINKILNIEIGDHEKVETKLKSLIDKLEVSNMELEQFAYISSHDLREPLRMITSFLQLLKMNYNDKLDEEANEFISFAINGAQRLERMISDLLDYSRIGKHEMEYYDLNSEKILELVLMNLKSLIKDNNAVVTHDSLPIIHANEQQMVQLFQNLIANAIKYKGENNPEIHIHADNAENMFIFTVKDNGIGIDEKQLERIFTIFQRLHTQEEYDGTGIGLAIAQKIVQQHGGNIWAKSKIGNGSTFYFTIPK